MFLPIALLAHSGFAQAAPVEVADGVYALLGDNGEATPENSGETANAGFIVDTHGVIAVDTGVSSAFGERMLAAIAAITIQPVKLAVITHPVQEFLFGAAAFQARGIPVLAHRETATLMQQRCATCLARLTRLLGADAMQGSKVVVPDRLVDGSRTLHVGRRKIELLFDGWASTPGDLAVFDRQTGTLFAGGLVVAGRVPSLHDANLKGWIAALTRLRKLPIRAIVPGFGPIGDGVEEIDQTLAYLQQLDVAVRTSYRNGESLIEAINDVHLPAFESLRQYATVHPQNVQTAYRQLEDADFH